MFILPPLFCFLRIFLIPLSLLHCLLWFPIIPVQHTQSLDTQTNMNQHNSAMHLSASVSVASLFCQHFLCLAAFADFNLSYLQHRQSHDAQCDTNMNLSSSVSTFCRFLFCWYPDFAALLSNLSEDTIRRQSVEPSTHFSTSPVFAPCWSSAGFVLTIQRFVRHSIHGLRNLMIRMIGPLALIPGRLHYVIMCHPRVSSCSLLSSIFLVNFLGREDVLKHLRRLTLR